MTAPAAGIRDRLSMSCDLETRVASPARRAVYHRDCVIPYECTCPEHERDEREVPTETGRPVRSVMRELLSAAGKGDLEVSEGHWFLPGTPP